MATLTNEEKKALDSMIDAAFDDDFEIRNSAEFKVFASDLAEYATKWVSAVRINIAKHAVELFNDVAIREMLNTYSSLKMNVRDREADNFIDAVINDDMEQISDSSFETLTKNKLDAYTLVLDDLIFYKYREQ